MKLVATLMITLFVLQASIATVPASTGKWACKVACWNDYRRCVSAAYNDYQRCQRFGEEAQCQFVLEFQKAICYRQYDSCTSSCR